MTNEHKNISLTIFLDFIYYWYYIGNERGEGTCFNAYIALLNAT